MTVVLDLAGMAWPRTAYSWELTGLSPPQIKPMPVLV